MRNLLIPLILLGLFQICLSHPGADHVHKEPAPINAAKAQYLAKKMVSKKVSKGKLPASWLKVEPKKAYKKTTDRGSEWIVEFHDKNAKDKSRSKVYVFLGLTGYVSVFKLTGE